jgi:hypothetical protein
MPRDGSLTLSDIREPTLAIGCGRYNVARLVATHGADAKLTELLVTLANCEKARALNRGHGPAPARAAARRTRARASRRPAIPTGRRSRRGPRRSRASRER